jgi:hypothetical protein
LDTSVRQGDLEITHRRNFSGYHRVCLNEV